MKKIHPKLYEESKSRKNNVPQMNEAKINILKYYVFIIIDKLKYLKASLKVKVQHMDEKNSREYIKEVLIKYICMLSCGYDSIPLNWSIKLLLNQ